MKGFAEAATAADESADEGPAFPEDVLGAALAVVQGGDANQAVEGIVVVALESDACCGVANF